MIDAVTRCFRLTTTRLLRRLRTSPSELARLRCQGVGEHQIYRVSNRAIYESVDLRGNPVIEERSAILKQWLRPILPDLDGRTFCVHLGDSPRTDIIAGMPNLCYCRHVDDTRNLKLVPDAHYQVQRGYTQTRKYRKLYTTRWEEKVPKAIFRGSCTGEKPLARNLRARLCALGHELVDARISRVNNGWTRAELAPLLGRELTEYQMAQYKYQIDIDGNSSSWCGLFWKLMAGSLTFKMNSGWQQWYYPRLKRGIHYESFGCFDELLDKIDFYKKNDDKARAIAINAQNFTKAFTVQDQLQFFLDTLKD